MYEYKFFPTPKQVKRGRGLFNSQDAMAGTLSGQVNLIAGAGWEFLRTESVPEVRRKWFFHHVTVYKDYMVFRRSLPGQAAAPLALPYYADTSTNTAPRIRPQRIKPTKKSTGVARPKMLPMALQAAE